MYIFIGIIGAILVLFGFYRTSIGKWTGKSFWYEMDNLIGAVLVTIYQLHYHAYVTMVVNIIWAIVAFRGVISYRERRPK
jgi:hypothetical protein